MDYLNNKNYAKPNFLISAKYKSSLLANKIIAIALADLKEAVDSNDGVLVSDIKAADLRKMLGIKEEDKNFYAKIKKVSNELTGKNIGITDPEEHSFTYLAVITRATYKKGILTVEWNRHLSKYLKEIKRNFTKLNLGVMLSFDNVYTFRLYEILKSNCYKGSPYEVKAGSYEISYDLPELRFLLGIANAELDSVKRVLVDTSHPDYEKAFEKSPEKIHLDWRDFRRKVLDPAINGIQISDLEVSYKTERFGLGGKIGKVVFYINDKNILPAISNPILQTNSKTVDVDDFIDTMLDIMPFRLRTKDLKKIASEAEYDIYKIKKAVDIAKKNQDSIENMTGFLIAAIKNNWDDQYQKEKITWNLKQKSDYGDMAELEKLLLQEDEQIKFEQQTIL